MSTLYTKSAGVVIRYKALKGPRNDQAFHRLYARVTKSLRTNYGEDQEPEAQQASAGKRRARRAMTVEEFYKRNYYFPFLDHVISHFENHFPEEQKHLLLAFCLLPSSVHELTDDYPENIKEEFLQNLPSPGSYDQELDRWQQRAQETRATTSASS